MYKFKAIDGHSKFDIAKVGLTNSVYPKEEMSRSASPRTPIASTNHTLSFGGEKTYFVFFSEGFLWGVRQQAHNVSVHHNWTTNGGWEERGPKQTKNRGINVTAPWRKW